jgi:hypothetical protein
VTQISLDCDLNHGDAAQDGRASKKELVAFAQWEAWFSRAAGMTLTFLKPAPQTTFEKLQEN